MNENQTNPFWVLENIWFAVLCVAWTPSDGPRFRLNAEERRSSGFLFASAGR